MHDLLEVFRKSVAVVPITFTPEGFSTKEIRRNLAILYALQTQTVGDVDKLLRAAKKVESYLEGPYLEAEGSR